ncbi:NUCLEAR FUSION DEFECTIVE 6, chloroplastic mitochondrial isoform X4 [Olea europaea subsp. europaea]|uniref:NUCLEAR FUSION DEFECTIVE 6, chloroplastic mitochondrial isoform X4 n=2 Tax=Olea europaea subsp. europaea TaxID=158383 RepID=A0A8S0RFY7_OLEEU|nr:NUCLEAR FUSION DEFECTIVE 6, chloroplastic mitochondrial isoform X4 [Olea europaea subsp. europaea]
MGSYKDKCELQSLKTINPRFEFDSSPGPKYQVLSHPRSTPILYIFLSAMASKCSRIINRATISTLRSALKKSNSPSATTSFPKPSLPSKPSPSIWRCPAGLGCVASMLPLHSAVATARMTSCLSSTSRSCRALSQDEIDGT